MKQIFLIFLSGLIPFLATCKSPVENTFGKIALLSIPEKDTIFITDWLDFNQTVTYKAKKSLSVDVAVLTLSLSNGMGSISVPVPVQPGAKNVYQLNVSEDFLNGVPVTNRCFSVSGNKMLDQYEALFASVNDAGQDTALFINDFVHNLYNFSKEYPKSGIVGYHVYEAEAGGYFSEMSKHFSDRSKKEWEELSQRSDDVFSKELQRIKASGNVKNCKTHDSETLVFQSSYSSIHPDVLKDNVKVVIFWATWCGPCKPQMMQLAELHKNKYHDSSVLFVAVTSESNEKLVLEWRDKNWEKYKCRNCDWESYWLSFFYDKEHCMATNYQIQQYPTIMVFDKNDKLVKSYCSVDEVEEIVDSLLKE